MTELEPDHFAALIAAIGILVHVAHYNFTAQLEYRTKIFTKILGRHAVYFYALLLVVCALFRDHLINEAVEVDHWKVRVVNQPFSKSVGVLLVAFGIILNVWTLKALGIKGMYNGDSFGWLMDAPVTTGPFQYFNDPQYLGTTAASLGWAMYRESAVGYFLTAWMGIVFYLSTKYIETPHMRRIYSQKTT